MKHILAVNFKAYPTAFGAKALKIARNSDAVAKEFQGSVEVVLLPPATELREILSTVSYAKVYAQHADPVEVGAYTGFIPPEILKDVGVEGIMINHSEHRMKLDDIEFLISKSKFLGLKTLVCGATPASVAAIASMNPYMVAVEPPELIGTGIPVSKAKPEVISNTVDRVRKVNSDVIILTGAGITSGEDARKAIELGTQGVLVASAVMKSADPGKKMYELANALAI